MPSIVTHPAVPLAIGLALGAARVPPRLLAAGVLASIVPDIDVAAFRLGIDDSHHLGHRGFSHSLAFAALLALLGALAAPALRSRFAVTFAFLFVAGASHGVLDSFTNGGAGIAFLWPFSLERFFAPAQVIEVSPIGLGRFFSPRGLEVLGSEALWVWLPCVLLAFTARASLRAARA